MTRNKTQIAIPALAVAAIVVGAAAVLSRPSSDSRPAPVYEQPSAARPAPAVVPPTQATHSGGLRTVNCGAATKEGGYTSAALAGDETSGSMHVGETPGALRPHDCTIYFGKPFAKAVACDVRTPARTQLKSTAAADHVTIHDVIQGADFTYTCTAL
jgi:hypothetical protein